MHSEAVNNAIERTIAKKGIKDYTLEYSNVSSKGDNYLGVLKRVKVLRKGDGECLFSFVIKIAPKWLEGMPINAYFNREICAYTEVLPPLQKSSGKLKLAEYYDGSDKDNEEYVIMADLTAEGFSLRDKANGPLDVEHLRLIFTHLAEFHAASFALKKRDPETFSRLESLVAADVGFGEQSEATVEALVNNLTAAVKNPDHQTRLMTFMESVQDMYFWYLAPETAAPYNVFVHGDCWINNVLIKYKNGKPIDMRLIDWQLMRLSSPVTDLLYLIYVCTDRKLRTEHLSSLFDHYYDTLSQNLRSMDCDPQESYPKSVFEMHIKMLKRYGLAAALINLPALYVDDDPKNETKPDMNFEELFSQPLTETCAKMVDEIVEEFVVDGYLELEEISSMEAMKACSPNSISAKT